MITPLIIFATEITEDTEKASLFFAVLCDLCALFYVKKQVPISGQHGFQDGLYISLGLQTIFYEQTAFVYEERCIPLTMFIKRGFVVCG